MAYHREGPTRTSPCASHGCDVAAKGAVTSQTMHDSFSAFLRSANSSRYIDKMGTRRDLDGRLTATHVFQPEAPLAADEER